MSQSAYKKAGVDIDAGNRLVDLIKPSVKKTARTGVMGGVGGFGALFDPKAAGYQDPILVSATDGVGTKLKVAIETGRHETVGQDLVAMCVNDLVVQGAEPLFFLDYFATAKLDVAHAESVIKGIAKGCELAGCALIGGETAEMPGMYAAGDYDLAGFSVGAVERDQMIDGLSINAGDVMIGLPSSGLHSNGFSLVRKIIEDQNIDYNDKAPFQSEIEGHETYADMLLEPTKIYTKELVRLFKNEETKGTVKGLAHITGGGLLENIPRILPQELCSELDAEKWNIPTLFKWLSDKGGLTHQDMSLTFNCGVGMVLVVDAVQADIVIDALAGAGQDAIVIGKIIGNDHLNSGSYDVRGERVGILNAQTCWK